MYNLLCIIFFSFFFSLAFEETFVDFFVDFLPIDVFAFFLVDFFLLLVFFAAMLPILSNFAKIQ
jgi:hypothetical protein